MKAKIYIKDDTHTEIYDDSTKIISKVLWMQECSYYLKVIVSEGSSYIEIGDSLEVDIVNIKYKEMTYKSKYKGVNFHENLIKHK